MIRTVTLNSGFDEVFTVANLNFGMVGDVIRRDNLASGKGFNAARIVRTLGEDVKAYGLIGAADQEEFRASLTGEGIDSGLVCIDGTTRRNLTVLAVDNGLPAAHLKGKGFEISSDEPVRALMKMLSSEIKPGDIVTLNGSTPSGLDSKTWAAFGRMAVERGAKLLVDVYGEPLIDVLSRCRVFLCKPNEEEIQILISNDTEEVTVRNAIDFMVSSGVTLPIVTLGKAGLCFANGNELWAARCEVQNAKILVGAGDACLAGLAIGALRSEQPLPEIARYGVAVASAYVSTFELSDLTSATQQLLPRVIVERVRH
jgi:1-phosphofructokinase family hexose kinase